MMSSELRTMSDRPSNGNSGAGAATAPAKERKRPKAASSPRMDRVEKLRRQYEEGAYLVDAAEVSKRIIDEHLK